MTVKVKNISGLENYATSIQGFAGKFELAANDTVREFNTSLEGEKAEAINAFFSVLNNIQTTIFSTAPEAIRTYGRHISTFTDAIKGLGFSSLAYTDDDAMTTLLNSLTTPQRNEITIVKDNLVTVLDEAVEAMGEGDSSLGSFDLVADMYITTEVLARSGTHTGIILADSALSDNVNGSADLFTSLTAQTQNAKAVTKVSIPDLLGAIKSGNLNKDKMVYLYRVSTDADVKILNAQLNGNIAEIANIMAQDPAKVSDGAYKNVAEDMTSWLDRSESGINKMQSFLYALEKADQSKVKDIVTNLGNIHAVLKKIHVAEMKKFEKSSDYNEVQWNQYTKELQQMNDLSGLLASIRVLKIGTEHKRDSIIESTPSHKVRDSYVRRGLRIGLNNAADAEWYLSVSTASKVVIRNENAPIQRYDKVEGDIVTTYNNYTSHFENGIVGSLDSQFQVELEQIAQEQRKAEEDFYLSVAKNGMKAVIEFVGGPVASGTFSILTNSIKPDVGEGVENTQNILEEMTSGRIKTIVKNTGNVLSPIADSLQEFIELDEQVEGVKAKKDKLEKKIYNLLVGQGGWALYSRDSKNLRGSKPITESSDIYTDYGAYKRIEELNQKGIMGFVEDQQLKHPEKVSVTTVKETINEAYHDDPRMRDFLLGEHSDEDSFNAENASPEERVFHTMTGAIGELFNDKPLTVQDMTPEQISQIHAVLIDTVGEGAVTNFDKYFSEKYGS